LLSGTKVIKIYGSNEMYQIGKKFFPFGKKLFLIGKKVFLIGKKFLLLLKKISLHVKKFFLLVNKAHRAEKNTGTANYNHHALLYWLFIRFVSVLKMRNVNYAYYLLRFRKTCSIKKQKFTFFSRGVLLLSLYYRNFS
jgi:hypothetical protein